VVSPTARSRKTLEVVGKGTDPAQEPRSRRGSSLGAMAFKIIYADGSEKQYEDDDRYGFNKGGHGPDRQQHRWGRRILSPTAWHAIEDPEGTRTPSLPSPDLLT
jgi:hypothetical protein